MRRPNWRSLMKTSLQKHGDRLKGRCHDKEHAERQTQKGQDLKEGCRNGSALSAC